MAKPILFETIKREKFEALANKVKNYLIKEEDGTTTAYFNKLENTKEPEEYVLVVNASAGSPSFTTEATPLEFKEAIEQKKKLIVEVKVEGTTFQKGNLDYGALYNGSEFVYIPFPPIIYLSSKVVFFRLYANSMTEPWEIEMIPLN